MRTTSRRPAASKRRKYTPLSSHSDTLASLVKTRLISKRPKNPSCSPLADKIQGIVDEEVLTCSVCLQLLLSPVQAQCGHPFCLSCAEDLAKNGFACAICHSHQPTYQLPSSSVIENLLQFHLSQSEKEKRQEYLTRKASLERKEQERLVGEVQEGQLVDFWSQSELEWKSGEVVEKSKTGTLSIAPRRTIAEMRSQKNESELVTLHQNSRLLAPHHYFSKADNPEVQEPSLRPLQFFQGSIEPLRITAENRPPMFNFPMFFSSMGMSMEFWRRPDRQERQERPQEMINPFRSDVFDGLEPFNF